MNYLDFIKQKPNLYGSTIDNNLKQRIGMYQPCFNKYANTICYYLMGANGGKTKHGFTLRKAFDLFSSGRLSTNPEKGKDENYIGFNSSP